MNISSAALPRFHKYADLETKYNAIAPLRSGRERGKKPLGNRRYKYCQIHKHDETGAFTLELHNSPVITWFPNDIVHFSMCGWDTTSTRQFMAALTPYDVLHDRGISYLCIGAKATYPFENAQTVLEVDINTDTVLNPTQEFSYAVDRKKMKEVKQRYADFREYLANMGKILTAIKESEVEAVGGNDRIKKLVIPAPQHVRYYGMNKAKDELAQFLTTVREAQEKQDLEAYYRLFVQVGVSCLYYHYLLKAYIRAWREDSVEIGEPMLYFFDEVLKHNHKEEIFIKKEVPIGKKVSNENRKYFY